MKITFQKVLKLEPLIHVMFWALVLFYPYIKFLSKESRYPSLGHEIVNLVFDIVVVYVMYLWFFPRPKKAHLAPLVLVFFILMAIGEFMVDGIFHPAEYHDYWAGVLSHIISYCSLTLLFFAIYVIKQLYIKQTELDTIIRQNQEAELKLLKGQINPHFLFNTLNTIYASALEKDERTPDLILKLSKNFRYVLSEGDKKKVSLKKEINHIKGYIGLQEARVGQKIKVHWREDVDDYDQELTPLLLISLVENAFKYTSMLKGQGLPISINITLGNKKFKFSVENPCTKDGNPEIEGDAEWKSSGIGLKNTRRRLQYLYPQAHDLCIQKEKGIFIAELSITL